MVKLRHSSLWSQYDLRVVWLDVILCEINF